jgi:hypothetical protein
MLCGTDVDFPQQSSPGYGERLLTRMEVVGQFQALALMIGTQAFCECFGGWIGRSLKHEPDAVEKRP